MLHIICNCCKHLGDEGKCALDFLLNCKLNTFLKITDIVIVYKRCGQRNYTFLEKRTKWKLKMNCKLPLTFWGLSFSWLDVKLCAWISFKSRNKSLFSSFVLLVIAVNWKFSTQFLILFSELFFLLWSHLLWNYTCYILWAVILSILNGKISNFQV